jgi:hypothetical protein
MKDKSTLLMLAIAVLALVLCQSCNPYSNRRVPIDNYSYINCKNCKNGNTKQSTDNHMDESYEFVGQEGQKAIQPLPIQTQEPKPARNSNVKKYRATKPAVVGADKKDTSNVSGVVAKKNDYVKLSETPAKAYSVDQQKTLTSDKKADIQNLLNKSEAITSPTASSATLAQEQAPSVPTQEGEVKLNDKLQELQKMIKDNASEQKPATANMDMQPMPAQADQQPVQPAPAQPVQQQPPAQPEPVPGPDVPSSSYDITNKPIPLPH